MFLLLVSKLRLLLDSFSTRLPRDYEGTECLYVLVNNAADGATQPLLEATPEHVESSFGVNTYGPIYMTQAVVNIGKMPRGGRIINIGTVVSKMGMALAAVYAAAKAAQDSLTASWASEVITPCPFPARRKRFLLTALDSSASNMESRSIHLHLDQSQRTHLSNTL